MNTIYLVPDLGVSLQIGRASREMDKALMDEGASHAIVLTAANPFSRECSDDENQARNQRLAADLVHYPRVYPAVGQPLADDWAAEESACVFDVPFGRADELADQFQQMAYVVYANGSTCLRVRHMQIRRWLESTDVVSR